MKKAHEVSGLERLHEQGGLAWIAEQNGWVAVADDVVNALSADGFEECKRELTTSRRDSRPAGGVWQGVNPRTGSVASAIWVNGPTWPQAVVFLTIDGQSLTGPGLLSPEHDPYREDGGEA